MSFYFVFNELSRLPRRVNTTLISIEFAAALMDADLRTLECFVVSHSW